VIEKKEKKIENQVVNQNQEVDLDHHYHHAIGKKNLDHQHQDVNGIDPYHRMIHI